MDEAVIRMTSWSTSGADTSSLSGVPSLRSYNTTVRLSRQRDSLYNIAIDLSSGLIWAARLPPQRIEEGGAMREYIDCSDSSSYLDHTRQSE